MKRIITYLLALLLPLTVQAHRSGCHSKHSCPSDSGSYICGDKGHCDQCPDNQFCKGGLLRLPGNPVEEEPPPDYHEADYQDHFCAGVSGETEYILEDRTRVDCLTSEYAIEVDFAKKWAEAIGQALYYGAMTGRKPGILIILEDEDSRRHLPKIEKVIEQYGLSIRVWIIKPEALSDNH